MENKEAIRILSGVSKYADKVYREALTLAISALEKQEQDRWIPVTEKLPEDDKDVLCFSKIGFYCVASHGKMYPGSKEVGWITSDYTRLDESVILAWRPLPERYQEDEA